MAFVTGTAFGNNLTRIAFSAILHRETQDKVFFQNRGMVARDTGGEAAFERKGGLPIRSQEALNARRAQEVRVGMINQLTTNRSAVTGARTPAARTYGSGSSNNMIDNEETPALRNCIVYVEQSKHAALFDTPEIQDLRTEFKMTAEVATLLSDWQAQENEDNILDAIYNQYSGHVVAGVSAASAADHPTANQKWGGTATQDSEVGATEKLSPDELRRMSNFCEVQNINPIKKDGRDCYILLVHPYQYADLMANSEFQASFQNGWQRASSPGENPLFSMADAEYMGIYVHKYNRVRASSANANCRRAILMGADAVAEGITSRPRLVRRKEDQYEDVFGLGIKSIVGWARFDWAPQSGTTLNQSSAIWGLYSATTA